MSDTRMDSNSTRESLKRYESGDINERLLKLEKKVAELGGMYDGIMKELLDQKSIIRTLTPPKPRPELPKTQVSVKEIKKEEKAKDAKKGTLIIATEEPPKPKKAEGTKPVKDAREERKGVSVVEKKEEGVEIIVAKR
ncbi:MAG TPA: hypothetical protein HA257_10360 [Candidatus Methanoperedenaceae archaeon]|nr:hypothetical protein [Candidatus Methanoperedenaceae archaeon]